MARFTTNIPKISKSLQQAIDLTSSNSEMVKAARLSQHNLITDVSNTTRLLQEAIRIPDSIAQMLNATSLSLTDAHTAALSSLNVLGLNGSTAEMIKVQAEMITAGFPQLGTLNLTGYAADMIKAQEVITAGLPQLDTLGMTGYAADMIKAQEMLTAGLPTLDALSLTGHTAEMIKATRFSQQDIINDALRSTAFLNDTNGLDGIFNQSLKALSMPEYFASAAEIIERNLSDNDYMSSIPSAELNLDNDVDLQSAIDTEDVNLFKKWFEQLPIILQLLLVFIFIQTLQPVVNNITANLITPYVEEAISDWSNSDRDKVKVLKKLTFEGFDTPMSDLRFISGDNVQLREMPSIKSEAIDELRIGRIVVFLSKERNWTEVMVQYDEGEPMIGWVFTRYVKRFNNIK